LIAVGCAVEGLERFDGKCVVEIDVADAIKNPEVAIVKLEKAV
jgi:PTS system fructose-specific IIB component/fructose-specific PTS system IIB-like component